MTDSVALVPVLLHCMARLIADLQATGCLEMPYSSAGAATAHPQDMLLLLHVGANAAAAAGPGRAG